ncbi:hypothetical protein GCM10009839_54470 [Catenulispora yoronensis]|uniref:Carrier domain-containing protein n=1 Tax=Catenulispora yoronensis TaxID=450799 RepID=A0ABP5GDR1_9ACTN
MTTKVKLSRIQEQLWLAERLGQHATAYMVPLILQITGPIDESALRAAFVDIVTRHEILRTRFFEQDGVLRGEVRPVADFVFETESYSLAELAERGGPAGMQAAETAVLIDVSQSIPIKVKLIRTGAGDQLLSLVLHHLVFDDWSRNQFYAELAERYRAHLAGGAASQPLALQYHEYVARQEERDAEFREESLAYWHEVLTDLDPFEIEPDHPRSARRRGRGASTGFEIEAGLATGIRRLGRAQGASPAMVLFAAAQLVLARFTGRDDVSFGTTLAAREEDEAQELIGPLINTVLLRGDLSGDPTFAELVDRMADTMLDAMEHSRIPFNELIAAHGVVADLSRNPLTQIIVQYASGVRRPPELDGCEVRELPPLTTGSKFDLVILFDEFEDGRVRAGIGFDRDLYAPETIQSLADSLRAVIEDVVAAPDTHISAVRMPSPTHRSHQLLEKRHREEPAQNREAEPSDAGTDLGAETPTETLTATLSEHQRELLEIWRDVLETDDVTTTSNFFLSGGQSLLALRMTNRAREQLDVELPLSLVFEAPVFKDFSDRLAEMLVGATTNEGGE